MDTHVSSVQYNSFGIANELERSWLRLTLCIVVAVAIPVSCYTQQNQYRAVRPTESVHSSPTIFEIVFDDVEIFYDNGIGFVSAPARYDTEDWLYLGAVVGATVFTMTQDEELREIAFDNKDVSPAMKNVLDVGTAFGDMRTATAIASAFYLPGLISDSFFDGEPFGKGELRTTGRLLGESLFYSGLVAVILRGMVGRKRPNSFPQDEGDAWSFDMFNLDAEQNAFPSGHSVITFAISTTIAEYYDSWIARGLLYSAAGVGAYARYLSDGHWTSDILLGAAIGVGTGLYVVSRERARALKSSGSKPAEPSTKLSFYPTPNGVVISLRL
jgi:PAP2 superfamily protein